jgi:hypothetical protein
MNIRELEIMKSALEGDIIRQKNSPNAEQKEFKKWLIDTEKLLKKVNLKRYEEEAKRFQKED